MKNKNIIIWLLAIISITSTSALVTLLLTKPDANQQMCHSSKQKNRPDSNCHEKKLMSRLQLDEEQKTKFINQRKIHYRTITPVFDSLKILRTKLFEELKANDPDSNSISLFINKISEQETIIQREGVSHILEMKKILNPSQFDTLINIYSRAMIPAHKNFIRHSHKNCHKTNKNR
jgi:Spy/CpxP family protein refolding chaperone